MTNVSEPQEMIGSASTRNLASEGCNRKLYHSFELRELGLSREFHTDPDPPPDDFKADAALTGNVLHDMVEARLLGIEDPEEYARENRPLYPERCPKQSQHSWEFTRITFDAYSKKYPLDRELPIWEVPEGYLSLEYKWVENEAKPGSLFRDKGFFDRVLFCEDDRQFEYCIGVHPTEPFHKGGIARNIHDGGEFILTDTKSTGGKLKDRFWRSKLYNSVQFPLYCHHLHQMTDQFYGLVLVDGIQHTKTKRSFERFFFEYDENEIALGIQTSDDRIQKALEDPDHCDSSKCFAWGRKCAFYALCYDRRYSKLPVEERFDQFIEDHPSHESVINDTIAPILIEKKTGA